MGERARKVAASVEGVKSVTVDLLEPNPNACSKSEWLDLRASLNKDLIADKLVPAPNVHLATPQCHVFLTGLLGSQTEIDRAVEIAGRHPKTAGVTSYLRVYNAPAGD
jgi:hyperosmotically inducible protein